MAAVTAADVLLAAYVLVTLPLAGFALAEEEPEGAVVLAAMGCFALWGLAA